MKNRIAAFVTAAVCLAQAFPVIYAENNGEYMYISSADEFADLAKRCSMDSYSKGKTVVINSDIDFTGKEFEPLAYWDGMLDGSGHTISGINMNIVDGTKGLIGIIGENGEVKNLNVKADIKAKEEKKENNAAKIINKFKNDMPSSATEALKKFTEGDGISSVGGICGVNRGKIVGCLVEGSVKVASEAGGICGVNDESGRIEGCTNSAAVKADYNTGGIVGKNYGMVKWCTNYGGINPDPNEVSQNTGGICGRSYGAVEQCTNDGNVGYKSTGYNTGGITGCQNGYISECINNGTVKGRKDVGGITGQFEPYTNIDFKSDDIQDKVKENLEQLKNDLDGIADDISARNSSIQQKYKDFLSDIGLLPAAGTSGLIGGLGEDADKLTESISDALSRMGDHGDEVVGILSDAQSTARDISDNATRLTDSIEQGNQNLETLINTTVSAIDSGSEDSSKLVDELVSTLEDVQNNDDTERVTNQLIDTLDKLSEIDPRINVNMGNSSSVNKAVRDVSRDVEDILSPFVEMSEDLNSAVDSARERRKKINEAIEKLKELREALPTVNPIPGKLPIATNKPDTVKEKLKVGNLFTKTVYAEDNDGKSTIEKLLDLDIKDMDIPIKRNVAGEVKDAAVIRYSINNGSVEGLSDTGGIAGCVSFDSLSKPEENINLSGDYSLNPSTAIKAVIGACVNNGDITAKNTYSGGITGYSDLGSVKESISTGKITVTDGSFAGGISGQHSNNITHCISTSDIEAKSDAGGIAGAGKNIDTSYALARIKSEGEKTGAIAGSAGGNVKYNYFLREDAAGIDGINYNEKAEPVDKEVLASDSGKINEKMSGFSENDWVCATGDLYMPQLRAFTENNAEGIGDTLRAESADCAIFRFKVKFVADNETVKEFRVDYGYVLKSEDIPQLPKGDNTYGDWDKSTKEPIVRNTVFTAEYNQSKSTLSYGGEPPKLLVEGNFRPDTVLEVTETPGSLVVEDDDFNAKTAYDFKISESSGDYDGEVTVRVRYKDAKSSTKIGCVENDAVILTDYEQDGSYLKFKMDKPGQFVILEKKPPVVLYTVLTLVLLAALAAALFIIKKKKNKKSTEEEDNGGKTQE